MSAIRNRIEKNDKKIRPWAERKQYQAYRLYDLDIPEYPFILDRYHDHLVFYDRSNDKIARDRAHLDEAKSAVIDYFSIPKEKFVLKERERQRGLEQYEKLDKREQYLTIQEGSLKFDVNLFDYLDTGLFLDHRPLRERLVRLQKLQKILNLFCYTGSLSVAAAFGGAQVTSIDMSATYLKWAERNFVLNSIDPSLHRFFRFDILQYLEGATSDKYDLILLDPPTFSNSKKMQAPFEVEQDQDFLIENCMKRLAPEGLLIFSNNKKKFKLSDGVQNKYHCRDITEQSIPQDFHNKSIHNCFEIRTSK